MKEAMEKTEFKQTEVGVIPRDWKVKILGDLVEKFVNGGTPSTQVSGYWKGKIPWITGADILNQKVSVIRRYISREAVKNSSTNIIEKNTLLLVSRTGVGKLAITPFDVAISQDFTGVYTKKSEIDTGYLFRYLDFAQEQLTKQNQGTSIQGITRETLASIPIPLPPTKAEQAAIATALNDADALITQLEKLIAKKRNIKQGAMQELLKPKEGWEVRKLGEIADIEKGEQLNRETLTESGAYPVYNGGISPSGYTNKWNTEIETIIISEGGNSCGYVNYIKERFWRGGHCYKVKSNIEKEFLFHLLRSLEKNIMNLRVGSGLPNIQRGRLLSFELSITKDKATQTHIAQILSDMDAEIEALEKKLWKYKMIKQGMMQNLLTGRVRLV